ncbi:MAG: TRAP transporter substrate-binding protein [Myxococcota bacterium]
MLRARPLLAPFVSLFSLFALTTVTLSAHADPIVLKIATQAPDGTPWATLLTDYKSAVESASKGRIKVVTFLGGKKGDENETVRMAGNGGLQAVAASTGALASLVPELNMLEIPFTFKSFGEADYVLDEVLTAPMEKLFRDRGLVLGFWSENGFRHFGSNFEIKTPADLKSQKVRSQESAVHTWMWGVFGAAFQAIPTTEVLTALTNHNVDGFDQTLLFAIAAKWHKTVKYVTMSGHIYQPAAVAFNKAWFDALEPDLQKILIDAGRAVRPDQKTSLQESGREQIRALNKDLIKLLKKDGVTVNKLDDAGRKAFESAIAAELPAFMKGQPESSKKIRALIEAGLKTFRSK